MPLWLVVFTCLLAASMKITELHSAWLTNLGFVQLDASLLPSARGSLIRLGTPEALFQSALQLAGASRYEPAYGLGRADLASGRYRAAARAFQAGVLASPQDSGAHVGLGFAYQGAGDQAAAIAEWRMAGARRVLLLRGADLEQAGELRNAADLYLAATEVDPGSAEGFWRLGSVDARLGETQQAIPALQRAVSLSPDDWRFRRELGLVYMASGALEPAAEQFKIAVQLVPHDFWTTLYLASVELRLERLDEASSYARAAVELNPQHPRPHFILGSVDHRRGQLTFAVAEYLAAVQTVETWNRELADPIALSEQSEYWLALAQAYRESGQIDPAIRAYQAVLGLDPGNASAIAALRALGVGPAK
jgi:tetratricopeptide (TPR) repeat protein